MDGRRDRHTEPNLMSPSNFIRRGNNSSNTQSDMMKTSWWLGGRVPLVRWRGAIWGTVGVLCTVCQYCTPLLNNYLNCQYCETNVAWHNIKACMSTGVYVYHHLPIQSPACSDSILLCTTKKSYCSTIYLTSWTMSRYLSLVLTHNQK